VEYDISRKGNSRRRVITFHEGFKPPQVAVKGNRFVKVLKRTDTEGWESLYYVILYRPHQNTDICYSLASSPIKDAIWHYRLEPGFTCVAVGSKTYAIVYTFHFQTEPSTKTGVEVVEGREKAEVVNIFAACREWDGFTKLSRSQWAPSFEEGPVKVKAVNAPIGARTLCTAIVEVCTIEDQPQPATIIDWCSNGRTCRVTYFVTAKRNTGVVFSEYYDQNAELVLCDNLGCSTVETEAPLSVMQEALKLHAKVGLPVAFKREEGANVYTPNVLLRALNVSGRSRQARKPVQLVCFNVEAIVSHFYHRV